MTEQDKLMFVLYAEQQIQELPKGYKTQEGAQDPKQEPPVWAVTANIVQEHIFGEAQEIKRGTKNFRAGAKVYIVVLQNQSDRVEVVGHSRGGRIIKIWTRLSLLENLKVEMVYSPAIVRHLTNYDWSWSSDAGYTFYSWKGDEESRIKAEKLVALNSQSK